MSNPSSGGLAAQLLNQLQGQPLEQMAQQLDVSPAQAGSAVSAALGCARLTLGDSRAGRDGLDRLILLMYSQSASPLYIWVLVRAWMVSAFIPAS